MDLGKSRPCGRHPDPGMTQKDSSTLKRRRGVHHFGIKWDSRAVKDLRSIDREQVKVILKKISELANDPFQGKQLRGQFQHYRRIRIGNYRVIYSVLKEFITIQILRIGSRGKVYKRKI
ncbi:MAG: type II toxin-antitoxin system RelE/ParE family toxin [FCB group bacterium]|nr:type II toxin-antitoxin system RelE/ParE family toxin [FCB group bacterium]